MRMPASPLGRALYGTLRAAWDRTKDDYDRGRVNSEGTLEAAYYHHLRSIDPGLIVYCQAAFTIDCQRYVPDIVIVDRDQGGERQEPPRGRIAAVVQLKFVPHGFPMFESDFRVLSRLSQSAGFHVVSLDPSSGKMAPASHAFCPETLLVLGVVGRHDAAAVFEKTYEDFARDQSLPGQVIPLVYGVPSSQRTPTI